MVLLSLQLDSLKIKLFFFSACQLFLLIWPVSQFPGTSLPIIHIHWFSWLLFMIFFPLSWSLALSKNLKFHLADFLLLSFSALISQRLRSQPPCSLGPLGVFIHDYPFEKQQPSSWVCVRVSHELEGYLKFTGVWAEIYTEKCSFCKKYSECWVFNVCWTVEKWNVKQTEQSEPRETKSYKLHIAKQ